MVVGEAFMNCKGSGKNLGLAFSWDLNEVFKCPDCDKESTITALGQIIVPDHAKHCDHNSDNDYCSKCAAPQGSMRDLIYSEWEDQLGRGYDG
jgi:transcription elongation factor Elf1